MTSAKTREQLRRLDDLSSIRRAVIARLPDASANSIIGLTDIAALCKARGFACAGLDPHVLRDQLLTIACDWDLARDRLEDQSDTCLAAIAGLLRP